MSYRRDGFFGGVASSLQSKTLWDGEKVHELYLEKPGDLKMKEVVQPQHPKIMK